jgi:DNA-binding transcriptional LysR family regulator
MQTVAPALDLDLLRTFAVFAAQLNFTRAAAQLHLSQPAVHAHVGRLAESLGVTLYRREGRGLALTAEGRRVAAFARETGERAEAFVAQLRGDEAPRPVCLCAGAGSYVHLLGEALRGWSLAGGAPTRLLTRDRDGTIEALRAGEAHLGVAPMEARPPELSMEVLGVIPQVLAVPSTHALAARRAVRLRDLDGVRLVAPSPDRPHRQALDAALAAAGARW